MPPAARKRPASARPRKRPASAGGGAGEEPPPRTRAKADGSLAAAALARALVGPGTALGEFRSAAEELGSRGRLNQLASSSGPFRHWLLDLVYNESRENDSVKRLEILLNAGLDPDTDGLLFESVYGFGGCMHTLLEHGADPVVKNPQRCPFVAAAEDGAGPEQFKRLHLALIDMHGVEEEAKMLVWEALERVKKMRRREYGEEELPGWLKRRDLPKPVTYSARAADAIAKAFRRELVARVKRGHLTEGRVHEALDTALLSVSRGRGS